MSKKPNKIIEYCSTKDMIGKNKKIKNNIKKISLRDIISSEKIKNHFFKKLILNEKELKKAKNKLKGD